MTHRARLCLAVSLGLIACAPASKVPSYDVTLSDSGKLALVSPLTPVATIAGIEAASRGAAPHGCTATAAPVIYDIVADDRTAPLPASAAKRFAGRFPVTLDC